mmetsp:Transcript_147028/g.259199  ORF Transcript_147028/g.259199 Transcript_147028/m.259199 type:complete len:86 (+) Transcript_147028:225-482(+)
MHRECLASAQHLTQQSLVCKSHPPHLFERPVKLMPLSFQPLGQNSSKPGTVQNHVALAEERGILFGLAVAVGDILSKPAAATWKF